MKKLQSLISLALALQLALPNPAGVYPEFSRRALRVNQLREDPAGKTLAGLEEKLRPAPPTAALEELGEWSDTRALQLRGRLVSGADGFIAEQLGAKQTSLFQIQPDQRGLLFQLLDDWIGNPRESKDFLLGFSKALGNPNERSQFSKAFRRWQESTSFSENSHQATVELFNETSGLNNKWFIAVHDIASGDFSYGVIQKSKELTPDKWREWLVQFRGRLKEWHEREYQLVQWDLKGRFPGKSGFILLHGSTERVFQPGRQEFHDGLSLTWSLRETADYAQTQLLIVQVPFEQVRWVSWLVSTARREPVIYTRGGDINVLETLDPKAIPKSPIPSYKSPVPSLGWSTYSERKPLPDWLQKLKEINTPPAAAAPGAPAGLEETEGLALELPGVAEPFVLKLELMALAALEMIPDSLSNLEMANEVSQLRQALADYNERERSPDDWREVWDGGSIFSPTRKTMDKLFFALETLYDPKAGYAELEQEEIRNHLLRLFGYHIGSKEFFSPAGLSPGVSSPFYARGADDPIHAYRAYRVWLGLFARLLALEQRLVARWGTQDSETLKRFRELFRDIYRVSVSDWKFAYEQRGFVGLNIYNLPSELDEMRKRIKASGISDERNAVLTFQRSWDEFLNNPGFRYELQRFPEPKLAALSEQSSINALRDAFFARWIQHKLTSIRSIIRPPDTEGGEGLSGTERRAAWDHSIDYLVKLANERRIANLQYRGPRLEQPGASLRAEHAFQLKWLEKMGEAGWLDWGITDPIGESRSLKEMWRLISSHEEASRRWTPEQLTRRLQVFLDAPSDQGIRGFLGLPQGPEGEEPESLTQELNFWTKLKMVKREAKAKVTLLNRRSLNQWMMGARKGVLLGFSAYYPPPHVLSPDDLLLIRQIPAYAGALSDRGGPTKSPFLPIIEAVGEAAHQIMTGENRLGDLRSSAIPFFGVPERPFSENEPLLEFLKQDPNVEMAKVPKKLGWTRDPFQEEMDKHQDRFTTPAVLVATLVDQNRPPPESAPRPEVREGAPERRPASPARDDRPVPKVSIPQMLVAAGLEEPTEMGRRLMEVLGEAKRRVAPYAVGGGLPQEVEKRVGSRLEAVAGFVASQRPGEITSLGSGGESVVLDLGNGNVLSLRPVAHWEHLKDYLELLEVQKREKPKYPFINRVVDMKRFDDLLLLALPKRNTQGVNAGHYFTIGRKLQENNLSWNDPHLSNIGLDEEGQPILLDLGGIEKTSPTGLEEVRAEVRERLEGMRSAAPMRGWVVVGGGVADRFPALERLAGLEERVLINRDPANTAFELVRLGAPAGGVVSFYGGLEEGEKLAVVADLAGISVRIVGLGGSNFNDELRQILAGLGIPDAAIEAGLEEMAADLTFLGQAA